MGGVKRRRRMRLARQESDKFETALSRVVATTPATAHAPAHASRVGLATIRAAVAPNLATANASGTLRLERTARVFCAASWSWRNLGISSWHLPDLHGLRLRLFLHQAAGLHVPGESSSSNSKREALLCSMGLTIRTTDFVCCGSQLLQLRLTVGLYVAQHCDSWHVAHASVHEH